MEKIDAFQVAHLDLKGKQYYIFLEKNLII